MSHNLLWFIDPAYSAANYYTDPVFYGPDAILGDPLSSGDFGASDWTVSHFRLQPDSPAIGAGTSSPHTPDTDFDGTQRADGAVTVGAFEAP